jgi:hypothetical protein
MTITYTIECQEDKYSEIEGSFASGNDEADRKTVKSIQERVFNGDIWAWCVVVVTAECHGFTAQSSYRSGCSYQDEANFKESEYYKDLCEEALEKLRAKLAQAAEAEREVYLALNPIAEAAPEFEIEAERDKAGCVTLSFRSAHTLYGVQSLLLQHDVDIEGLLKALSSDDATSLNSGWPIRVGIRSLQ